MTSLLANAAAGQANFDIPQPTPFTDRQGGAQSEPFFTFYDLNAEVNPQPTGNIILTGVDLAPGMITDYYNRIFVLPNLLDLRNPTLGAPQPYSIWNAFFRDNTLENIISSGNLGLVNTAASPLLFNSLQIRDFSVTVTAAAPIEVNATYLFDFSVGSGQLVFRVTRAILIPLSPNEPLRQQYEWRTDVLRAHDGTQQRVSTRSNPRLTLQYNVTFPSEANIRQQKRDLFTTIADDVILPVWQEPFVLTASSLVGSVDLFGDFAFRDFIDNDFLLLISPNESVSELVRVNSSTDGQITLENALNNSFSIGSSLYPTLFVNLSDGSSFDRHPVNVAETSLTGRVQDLRQLGGRGGSISNFASLPLLDQNPLNNDLVDEGFTINYDQIDYGNRFEIFSAQQFPNIAQARTFRVANRQELQNWKVFLDTVVGQREPFFHPTFRPDLQISEQPIVGGAQISIQSIDQYAPLWFPRQTYKQIMIVTADGQRQPRTVTSVTELIDGTTLLNLSSPLTATLLGSTIRRIEFLQKARLGSDNVEFRHFSAYSEVDISIETVDE